VPRMAKPVSDRAASLALFTAAAFWGLYWWPVREIGAAGFSPSFSVAFFNSAPLVILLPLVIWHRKTQFAHFRQTLLIGCLMGVGLGFYATGLAVSSVIRVTMLFYLTPVWSTIIGVFWLREPLTRPRIAAIVLGFAGLWLMLSSGDGFSQPLNFGDFFALASGVFWGFGAASIKRWPETPTTMTTLIQFIFVILFCTFVGRVFFDDPLPAMTALRNALPTAVLTSVLILLPTSFVMFVAAKQLFPGRVGILMMSEVLVAIISASILLPDETLSVWQWFGCATILSACLIEVSGRSA
jgi:drug/metabolite transporter (DMT)-like permease